PVPQGQRKAEPLFLIAEPGQPILPPVIGARAGLVVAEVVPGVSIGAVVLANGSPLPFAEVRSPLLPGDVLGAWFLQPRGLLICSHDRSFLLFLYFRPGLQRRAPA